MHESSAPGGDRPASPDAVRAARTTAHRLSNELSYIVGYGELLLRHLDPEGTEMARELIQAARDAAASASEIHTLLSLGEHAPG